MYFLSTRGNNEKITASQAIIKGLSSDRGLFVPSEFKNLKSVFDWLFWKGIKILYK